MSAAEDNLPEPDRLAVGLARLVEGFQPTHVLIALETLMAGLMVRGSGNETRALGQVAGHFANVEDRIKTHFGAGWERPVVARVPVPADVRPEVAAFALLMEQRLRENDHKPGWKNDHPQGLADQCIRHTAKLGSALERLLKEGVRNLEANRNAIPVTAADIANFALMTADVVMAGGLIGKPDGEAA